MLEMLVGMCYTVRCVMYHLVVYFPNDVVVWFVGCFLFCFLHQRQQGKFRRSWGFFLPSEDSIVIYYQKYFISFWTAENPSGQLWLQ